MSVKSLRTVKWLEDSSAEIELQGTLHGPYELYLDNTRIPVKSNQPFKVLVKVKSDEESHALKVKQPGVHETSYIFQFKKIQEVPLPIRINIRSEKGTVIHKSEVFTGSFPAVDWFRLGWTGVVETPDSAYLAQLEKEKEEKLRKEREQAERIQQELARVEEERLQKEKLAQEQQAVAQRLAQLEAEKKKAEAEQKEKARIELARLEAERLEREKAEQARLAEEKAARELAEKERLEKERLEKERALAAVAPQIEEVVIPRDPWGIDLHQGLGFFNLQQTGASQVSSTNWVLDLGYRFNVWQPVNIGLNVQTFLAPLTVSGVRNGPKALKAHADLGVKVALTETMAINPLIGFNYQTFLTTESVGYRDLLGPRLGVLYELGLTDTKKLHAGVFLDVFGSDTEILTTTNNQLGFRLFLEWKRSAWFFTSLYFGAE
ncbi:MAG: hypothetical protein ACKOA8_15305, partial [Deltaproteobacteria bacterium]